MELDTRPFAGNESDECIGATLCGGSAARRQSVLEGGDEASATLRVESAIDRDGAFEGGRDVQATVLEGVDCFGIGDDVVGECLPALHDLSVLLGWNGLRCVYQYALMLFEQLLAMSSGARKEPEVRRAEYSVGKRVGNVVASLYDACFGDQLRCLGACDGTVMDEPGDGMDCPVECPTLFEVPFGERADKLSLNEITLLDECEDALRVAGLCVGFRCHTHSVTAVYDSYSADVRIGALWRRRYWGEPGGR